MSSPDDQAAAPPGWTFSTDEISPGGWRVVGRDVSGHEVERQGGPDADAVLRDAWEAARWVDQQLGRM